ncbi:MAG: NAD(P)-dependent oxidoreductase, partial [Candidatus Firestonebacteria bacterium]
MKVMVIGASGMLGYDLARVFHKRDLLLVDLNIEGINTAQCDITDFAALNRLFSNTKPYYVINASAYTDVDACEENVELAYKVNSDGARNIARCAKEFGAAFLQVSTDYVFDGTKTTPYLETDLVNPLGVYGKSKLEGELQTAKIMKEAFIVRTALLYGRNRSNFVTKILQQ